MSENVNVMAILTYASVAMGCAPEIPGYNGTLYAISEEPKERMEKELSEARVAVASLIEEASAAVESWMHGGYDAAERLRVVKNLRDAVIRAGGAV